LDTSADAELNNNLSVFSGNQEYKDIKKGHTGVMTARCVFDRTVPDFVSQVEPNVGLAFGLESEDCLMNVLFDLGSDYFSRLGSARLEFLKVDSIDRLLQ
jgi:hypothetical protein